MPASDTQQFLRALDKKKTDQDCVKLRATLGQRQLLVDQTHGPSPLLANGSMSSYSGGEGKIRGDLIEVDLL